LVRALFETKVSSFKYDNVKRFALTKFLAEQGTIHEYDYECDYYNFSIKVANPIMGGLGFYCYLSNS